MKALKVLIFSDSICSDLPIPFLGLEKSNDDDSFTASAAEENAIQFHVEAFRGVTVQSAVDAEKDGRGESLCQCQCSSLSQLLSEDKYDVVVICFGTNDLGLGDSHLNIVANLVFLQNLCKQNDVKRVIGMFLRGAKGNDAEEEDDSSTAARPIDQFNLLLDAQSADDVVLSEFLSDAKGDLIDSDGLHLSEQGKAQLVQHLIELIEEE